MNTTTEVVIHKTKKEIQESPDYKALDNYMAVAIAEGFCEGEDANDTQRQAAWQYLHDTGMAYNLQGWFGRSAKDLISRGVIFD